MNTEKVLPKKADNITLHEYHFSFLPEREPTQRTVKSHTKILFRYRRHHGILAAIKSRKYTVPCAFCRNYCTEFSHMDKYGIPWFTCQWKTHLQITHPPFSSRNTPQTEWWFSQDGRVEYGSTTYCRHDPKTGLELDNWSVWTPSDVIWEFDIDTETWKSLSLQE